MGVILGSGEYRYEVIENFGKLPDDWTFHEVAAVAVDNKDQLYCFTRGKHPVIVFDRDGNFLRSWGDGVFKRAHGATIGPDTTIFLTDDGDHTVRKCSLDGKILMTIGVPGSAAPYQSGEPLNRCTHVAFSPKGEIYVSDGYGNDRVVQFDKSGKYVRAWGRLGAGSGELSQPGRASLRATFALGSQIGFWRAQKPTKANQSQGKPRVARAHTKRRPWRGVDLRWPLCGPLPTG